jgi:hypothetical protein
MNQANKLPSSVTRTQLQSGQLAGFSSTHALHGGTSTSQWKAMAVKEFMVYCVGFTQYSQIQNCGILLFGIINPDVMFLFQHMNKSME